MEKENFNKYLNEYLTEEKIKEEDLFKGNLETRILKISHFINYLSNNRKINYLYSYFFYDETGKYPFLMITGNIWTIKNGEYLKINAILTFNLTLPKNKEQLFEIIENNIEMAKQLEINE